MHLKRIITVCIFSMPTFMGCGDDTTRITGLTCGSGTTQDETGTLCINAFSQEDVDNTYQSGVDSVDTPQGENGADGMNGADGPQGETGADGPQGEQGGGCTTRSNNNGTYTITCADGSSVTSTEDTSCTINEDASSGTTETRCDDGTSFTSTPASTGVQTVTGLVGPGQSLSLTHSYTNAYAAAQYKQDGQLFDISQYTNTTNCITSPDRSLGYVSSPMMKGELSNGSIAILRNNDASIATPTTTGPHVQIINRELEVLVDAFEIETTQNVGDREITLTALTEGGFLIVAHDEPDKLDAFLYANDGTGQALEANGRLDIDPTDSRELNYFTTAATDSGFAVITLSTPRNASGVRQGPYELHIFRYTSNGQAFPGGNGQLRGFNGPLDLGQMKAHHLSGGKIALIGETRTTLDDSDRSAIFMINEQNEIFAQYDIGEDGIYVDNSEFAQAPNGNLMFAYELSSTDGVGYFVVDTLGNIIAWPKHVTFIEPDELTAGAFTSGDFAILIGEDDSVSTIKQIISNTGYAIGHEEMLGVVSMDDDHPIAWASGDNEMTLLYTPYSGNTRTISFAPGYLKLELVIETEVRLHNYGAQTADVMISVQGSL